MKFMLPQTDVRLWPEIQEYGCLFRCLTGIAELEAGRGLSADRLRTIWNTAVSTGALRARPGKSGLYVEDPNAIVRMAHGHLHLHGTAPAQRGSIALTNGAAAEAWGSPKGRWTILKGQTANRNSHFRLGNADGKEIWDPRPQTEILFEERVDFYA